MRMLHVSSSYPLFTGDSTAPFMEEMATALAAHGNEVKVLVPRRSGLSEGLRNGVEVVGFRYAPGPLQVWGYSESLGDHGRITNRAKLIAPVAFLSMTRAIRSILRSWRPDVLHLHWLLPQGAAALLIPRDIPVVISLHGADARLVRQSRVWTSVARRVLRQADHLVAASSEILEVAWAIEIEARRRSTVIPHGANADLFHPLGKADARRRLGLEPNQPVVLGVGRLVDKKGFEFLIRAAEGLPDSVRICLVGDGSLRSSLESLANRLAPGRVLFAGSKSRSELPLWFGASDVVAIPSVRHYGDIDSGPVVLMEALAAGRPVVATAIGMAPDLVRHGENGYIVDQGDPRSLAQCIRSALDTSDAMGMRSRQSFETIGDWQRVAHQLTEVYGDVVTHGRATRSKATRPR